MTQTIKASNVRQHWSQILNKVFKEETRVVVEKSGIPVAAVISPKDYERFTQMEQRRAERFRVLDEIGEAFKDVPAEEIEEQVAKAIAEVRAQNRQQAQNSAKQSVPGKS